MVIALSLLFVLALTASAWANPACAVCTVAVGASLEIARQLGEPCWQLSASGQSDGLRKKAGTLKGATGL